MRRVVAKEEREGLARESFASSLSAPEFARERGVNYKTLMRWRADLRRESPDVVARLAGQQTGACPSAGQSSVASSSQAGVSDCLGAPRFVECPWPGTSPMPGASGVSAHALEVVLPDGTLLRGEEPSALAELVRALRC